MDIIFANEKLRIECTNERERLRAYGKKRARALATRLDDLAAADNLTVMRTAPGHCLSLSGDRAGQFALDVSQPYRLIFVPEHDPIPTLDDGGMDWDRITAVRILEVVNYHE